VKLSVSLPEDDVAFLDEYAARVNAPSRSAALHHAIALLRQNDLQDEYAEAWDEWASGADAPLWSATAGDGMAHAAR
jgi:hypothetical protein